MSYEMNTVVFGIIAVLIAMYVMEKMNLVE
jgi:hypothetical protein